MTGTVATRGWRADGSALVRTAGRIGLVLGSALTTLFLLLALTFVIGRLLPLDPVAAIVGDDADQSTYEQVERELGLDKPLPQQFAIFVGRVLTRRLRQRAAHQPARAPGHRPAVSGDPGARHRRDHPRRRPRCPARRAGRRQSRAPHRPRGPPGLAARLLHADLLARADRPARVLRQARLGRRCWAGRHLLRRHRPPR